VLLLEAGGDIEPPNSGDDHGGEGGSTNTTSRDPQVDYQVPAFHAFASEHPDLYCDFWVHHYDDPECERRDPKYVKTQSGVLYPRCSALGGCTAHNAMIIVRPPNADWNHIWQTMGDPSWKASNMNRYFQRLERCRHRSIFHRIAAWLGWNPSGHGWSGWLTTEKAVPLRTLRDWRMRHTLHRAIQIAFERLPNAFERWHWLVLSQADPNDSRLVDARAFGVRYTPLSTHWHTRIGPRELLRKVERLAKGRLVIRTNALVSRIEIDPATHRATAVIYRGGRNLYGAATKAQPTMGEERRVEASAEIVLPAAPSIRRSY
jgi:choline dehydrogenase